MTLFTAEQANRMLPLVRRIVEDVVRQHRLWREKILELDLVASTTRAGQANDETDAPSRQAQQLARDIDSFERELTALGVQLKDRSEGLVDFPSEMQGRRVLLCWKLGESEVRFWHEEHTGFNDRRPLAPSLVG